MKFIKRLLFGDSSTRNSSSTRIDSNETFKKEIREELARPIFSPRRKWRIRLVQEYVLYNSYDEEVHRINGFVHLWKGTITDEGAMIFCDRIQNEPPKTEIVFYNSSGKLQSKFLLNDSIFDIKTNLDGTFFLIMTHGIRSEHPFLFAYAALDGYFLWSYKLPRQPSNYMERDEHIYIDEKAKCIHVLKNDKNEPLILLSLDGQLIQQNPQNEYMMLDFAQEAFREKNYSRANELVTLALAGNLTPNFQAKAYRLLGEIAEAQKVFYQAIVHYSKALELNPKIGVTKRLQELKEKDQS